MRVKDEQKMDLFYASTLTLVAQVGLVGLTIPLIAKQSKVATGTLYIYFKNKEELILSLFKRIKKSFQAKMFVDYDAGAPVKDSLRKMWENSLTYAVANYEEQIFLQQFNISPYRKEKETAAFTYQAMKPLLETLARGQQQGLIKEDKENLTLPLLFGFINQLASVIHENPAMLKKNFIDKTFRYFWDAISV
ncbi:MAG TPA: TetR/AcrR family transcriptional regulator [Puia sp.]|nr:TetR/AcrR family transcriptional regulator [Puia sp.]